MKAILIALVLFIGAATYGQNLIGAWEGSSQSESGTTLRNLVIFADGYQVIATYEADSGKFVSTNGGTWKLEGNQMTEVVEFDTENPDRVGESVTFEVAITENELSVVGGDMTLKRIDDGTPGALQNAWLMSGRIRDGKTQLRDTNRPRKTMKILSGTRFQWIAYHTTEKRFMGTGGGTYTTVDGVYTENIEFFSRDDSKAGVSLQFNYELIDGKWHHSGLSSKGDPIHEIWSPRQPQ